MIRCPGCGKQVYEDALNCPECGYSISSVTHSETKKVAKNVMTFAAIAAAVILAVVIYDACTVSAKEADMAYRKASEEYDRINSEYERLQRQLDINNSILDIYYGR